MGGALVLSERPSLAPLHWIQNRQTDGQTDRRTHRQTDTLRSEELQVVTKRDVRMNAKTSLMFITCGPASYIVSVTNSHMNFEVSFIVLCSEILLTSKWGLAETFACYSWGRLARKGKVSVNMVCCLCVCSGATSAFVRSYMTTKKHNIRMYAGGVPNLIMRQRTVSVNRAYKMSYTSLSPFQKQTVSNCDSVSEIIILFLSMSQ